VYQRQHLCVRKHKLGCTPTLRDGTGLTDAMMTRKCGLRGQGKRLLAFQAATFCLLVIALGIGSHARRDFTRTTLGAKKAGFLATHKDHDGTMGPNVMLWAWERAEDLEALDTQKAGVAFLAGTIFLRPLSANDGKGAEEGVVLRPRLQLLRVPKDVALMTVVRIETQLGWSQSSFQLAKQTIASAQDGPYTESQRQRVVSLISRLAVLPDVRAVQIDFDATRSEQGFYRTLLMDLRKALPSRTPISITALASWCKGDPWLEKLPPGTINEAVPMLFRMGPDAPNIASFLGGGNEFRVPACRGSLGLSTGESFSKHILNGDLEEVTDHAKGKRIYLFHPSAWSKDSIRQTIGALYKWHEESAP